MKKKNSVETYNIMSSFKRDCVMRVFLLLVLVEREKIKDSRGIINCDS